MPTRTPTAPTATSPLFAEPLEARRLLAADPIHVDMTPGGGSDGDQDGGGAAGPTTQPSDGGGEDHGGVKIGGKTGLGFDGAKGPERLLGHRTDLHGT